MTTGATRGMGSASARLFAQEGAAVVVAPRHKDQADALVSEITDAGERAIYVELDTTDYGQWAAAVSQIKGPRWSRAR